MKNTIELAAEFIHRGMVVDANALLKEKDECGVEYKVPSQAQYYALFKAINEAYRVHIQAHDCR